MNRRDSIKVLLGAAAWTQVAGAAAGAPDPDAAGNPRGRSGAGRSLPRIEVHPAGHLLQTAQGRPFFWLADTAWQLLHDTTREECSYYLRTRAEQGFTVIQAVVLTEFDGLNQPDEFGERPLLDNDPARPNDRYFTRVRSVVEEAAARGLYVALVPVWGDKLTAPWGAGPRIFRPDRPEVAQQFGRFLGGLLRDCTNVLWLLGGDRPPRLSGMRNAYLAKMARDAGFGPDTDWTPVWRALATGLHAGGGRPPLTVYHPQGGEESSSVFLHDQPWLSVNGMQSGHGGGHDVPVWEWIARDYALRPPKPTLDLEPNYEDVPYNPWPAWDPASGYFRDHDVRKQCYRSVFAGGCGVTYGHHSVWQFAGQRRPPMLFAERDWIDALWRPAGRQMQFLRALVESRPYFARVPDPALVPGDRGSGGNLLEATRDSAGSYAFVYFPTSDLEATVDLRRLASPRLRQWWYDPRAGVATLAGEIAGGRLARFRSPGHGPDWVLVLDGIDAGYAPPGLSVSPR